VEGRLFLGDKQFNSTGGVKREGETDRERERDWTFFSLVVAYSGTNNM
jgi:hypothetical protein